MFQHSLGAAKDSKLIAISTVPSFNYTSHKKDSVAAYVLYQVIDNAVNTATQTSFNGQPVYLLEKTIQPTCKGDEAGIGGGVISGTVGGEVKPTSGSSTVFVEGKALVREGDTCTMNNENTVGEYTTMDHTTMARIALTQAELDQDGEQEYQITAGPGGGNTDRRTGKVYPPKTEQQLEVERIRRKYESMIAGARFLGYDFAADNLQHFIDGKGGVRNIDSSDIRRYMPVTYGEYRIRSNVKNVQLQERRGKFSKSPDRITSVDYWIADIGKMYNPLSEFSYASGASKIRSDVVIDLNRNGNIYAGKGVVRSVWNDRYDWNATQAFDVPGYGSVSDDDGIFLKEHGGAKDFMLKSEWETTFEGSYDPKTKEWGSIKWTD